jgi:UDP-N-acetylglucosamine:LPS N-acetylglucosamine transferase
MHALLVSGSIGMGHDVMAEACAASLESRGWTTETVDSIRLLGEHSGGLGERVFRAMLAVPGVYDAFHFEQLRPGGRLAVLAERESSRRIVPALDAQLRKRPTDLLVSIFATAAGAAHRLKPSHPGLRTAVFCTDVCPHRIWVNESTDLYLVTSPTSRGFIRRFHPEARVAIVPAPIRPQFYEAPLQSTARAELGIPADEPCVLLMSGSWGLGPLQDLAAQLADAGVYTLAVAGRNAAAEAALRAVHERNPRLVPFGFTDRIPTLMAASDVVITSSGDTCSEARVIGRRLLLLDVVPGHGRENLQEELARGDADVAPTDPTLVRRAVLAALERVRPPEQRVTRSVQVWEAAFEGALAGAGIGSARLPAP